MTVRTFNEVLNIVKELINANNQQNNVNIANLKDDIAELKADLHEQKKTLDQLSKLIDDQTHAIEKTTEQLNTLIAYNNENVKPTINFINELKFKGAGILGLAGIFGSTVTWVAYEYWEELWKFIKNIR